LTEVTVNTVDLEEMRILVVSGQVERACGGASGVEEYDWTDVVLKTVVEAIPAGELTSGLKKTP